jgi:lipopolysaccharide transport protein LptA
MPLEQTMTPETALKTLSLAALAGAALCLALATEVRAQVEPARDIQFPETYPPPHQDRLKTLITGDELFRQKEEGSFLLKGVKIQTYRETGPTNAELVMRAPESLFDQRNRKASSPGPLQIDSGNGNMHLDGEGFLWISSASNSTMVVSNKVHTTLRREAMTQVAGGAATNSAPTQAEIYGPPAPNQVIDLHSESFFYERQTDLVTYTGNVRAEDDQLYLTCDVMTIKRATNGGLDNIVADRNVVIVSKEAGWRATGDHAVYTTKPGQEDVVLTGDPHWQDGAREGTGKAFVFDRLRNTMTSAGDAYLKLPRDSIGSGGILMSSPAGSATNAPGMTNKFVEIYSDWMIFQMPPTNGLPRTNGQIERVTAERNVIILDPEKDRRATGNRAVYTAATGVLELMGHALWQSGQQVARGEILIFDRENSAFESWTNAYLKLPAGTNASATNRFVGVLSRHYDYQSNLLTFHDEVHSALLEGEDIRAVLDCAAMKAALCSNQLQTIDAEGDVHSRTLPSQGPDGRTIEKDLKSGFLTMRMRTNSLVEEIVARQSVLSTQKETPTNGGVPILETLSSDLLTTSFMLTNEVEKMVAERNVIFTRDQLIASGDHAVYTATDEVTRLTGNPVVVFTNGTLTGDVVIMDRRNNNLVALNATIDLDVNTNKFGPAPAEEKPAKPARKRRPRSVNP